MNLLDRYIARAVIVGTLMVLLLLTSVEALFAFISEVQQVGKGDYDTSRAALYVLYTIPRRLHDYFSSSVLIGSLLSLGAMAGNSELIVMRAAGISPARIVRSGLQVGLILMVMMAVIGEWVAPVSDRWAGELRSGALDKRVSLGANGLWLKDGNRYINARQVMPDLHLNGLTVYEFDGDVMKSALHANRARYEQKQWILNGLRYTDFQGDNRIKRRWFKEERWDYLINLDLFKVLAVKPESMSAQDLRRYIDYLQENDLESDRYELAFWNALVAPFSTLVMLMLAMPFVFGSLRSAGAGQRLLLGTFIGIGYFLVSRLFNHLGLVYGLMPLLSALLPIVIFFIAALYSLRRSL